MHGWYGKQKFIIAAFGCYPPLFIINTTTTNYAMQVRMKA
jgi:hypothetical protein